MMSIELRNLRRLRQRGAAALCRLLQRGPAALRRLASAEFCLLLLGIGCFTGAQAAEAVVGVTPPNPVVVQPTAPMNPVAAPTAAPEAGAATGGKAAQAPGKPKAGKPVAKTRAKAKAKRR